MTRRRDEVRGTDRRRTQGGGTGNQELVLFPSLRRLADEIQQAQDRFEGLSAENRDLREQRDQQRQELGQLRQKTADLGAKCESLAQQLALAEVEVERSRTDALVLLFRQMAEDRHNQLLRKLLGFEGKEPGLLADLAQFFRDEVGLILVGQVDDEIILTDENLDLYEVQDAVKLPHRSRIIGRGISFRGAPIIRIEVEPIEEVTAHGD